MKIHFKNTLTRFGFIALAALAWSACGNTSQHGSADTKSADQDELIELDSSFNKNEPTFTDSEGNTIALDALKGKVVFINFWATWCPPCIHEMPSINELKNSFDERDDIAFIMVDVDNKIEQSTAFMKDNGYNLPVYVPAAPIPLDFLGDAIPTTVILNKQGEMVGRIEGSRDYSDPEIILAIKELLNEK